MKSILWLGIAVCFMCGFYWRDMFEDAFFLFNAFSFFLLSLYISLKDRNSFICYLWVCYSFNNLVDELIGKPTQIDLNEKIIIILTPVLWVLIKIWRNDRQI